jgi:hypothetical protein
MTEHEARTMLWHAANYLYENQLGDSNRVKAMDILDDIRRDWANWHDMSNNYNVKYRNYVVFRPSIMAQ